MKKLIRLLVLAALVATLAFPALAQNTPSTTAATPASGQDDAEAKTALYTKFTESRNSNPQAAYDAGKEYLAKYEAKDGPEDQYVKYIKKWVDSYDKIARRNQLIQQVKEKKYNEAFNAARQVLSDFPDDLVVLYELSKAGLFAATSGNEANNGEAANYAKKTIQLIESGKTFEKDKPIANKDEILGGLNYSLGFFLRKSQPSEAAVFFINAAQVEGFAKKDPQTYVFLAEAYESNEYKNLATQFNASCKTEDQLKTPECVELKAKADQVVDHMIDALARAIAYSNTSPDAAKYAQARTAWMEQLTNYYKYRTGSDTGLKELIASITSKPIPKPGEPVPALTPPTTPSSTPSSTTAPTQPSGTTTAAPSNMSTTTATKPTTATAPATTTTQPNGSKAATPSPGGKTSSTKPTPNRLRNHARRG